VKSIKPAGEVNKAFLAVSAAAARCTFLFLTCGFWRIEFCEVILRFINLLLQHLARYGCAMKTNRDRPRFVHRAVIRQAWSFLLAKNSHGSANYAQPSRSARRKETLWK
jgi:hypothetical protein